MLVYKRLSRICLERLFYMLNVSEKKTLQLDYCHFSSFYTVLHQL